jgi:hypothetical protein
MVAHGALLAAINPEIGRRQFARTAYGTALSVNYNWRIHSKNDRVLVPDYFTDWKYEVPNRVVWAWIIGDLIYGRPDGTPLVLTGDIFLEEEVRAYRSFGLEC